MRSFVVYVCSTNLSDICFPVSSKDQELADPNVQYERPCIQACSKNKLSERTEHLPSATPSRELCWLRAHCIKRSGLVEEGGLENVGHAEGGNTERGKER